MARAPERRAAPSLARSPRGADGATPQTRQPQRQKPARGFGIFLGDRLAVYYTFSSDLGNGWEDSETYHDSVALHEAALRMGVNLFVYAVTSRPVP